MDEVKGNIVRVQELQGRLSTLDEAWDEYSDPTYCEVCGNCDREDRLLLCDGCDLGYHLECLEPPLEFVPLEDWYCSACVLRHRVNFTMTKLLYNLIPIPYQDVRNINIVRLSRVYLLSHTSQLQSHLILSRSRIANPMKFSVDELPLSYLVFTTYSFILVSCFYKLYECITCCDEVEDYIA